MKKLNYKVLLLVFVGLISSYSASFANSALLIHGLVELASQVSGENRAELDNMIVQLKGADLNRYRALRGPAMDLFLRIKAQQSMPQPIEPAPPAQLPTHEEEKGSLEDQNKIHQETQTEENGQNNSQDSQDEQKSNFNAQEEENKDSDQTASNNLNSEKQDIGSTSVDHVSSTDTPSSNSSSASASVTTSGIPSASPSATPSVSPSSSAKPIVIPSLDVNALLKPKQPIQGMSNEEANALLQQLIASAAQGESTVSSDIQSPSASPTATPSASMSPSTSSTPSASVSMSPTSSVTVSPSSSTEPIVIPSLDVNALLKPKQPIQGMSKEEANALLQQLIASTAQGESTASSDTQSSSASPTASPSTSVIPSISVAPSASIPVNTTSIDQSENVLSLGYSEIFSSESEETADPSSIEMKDMQKESKILYLKAMIQQYQNILAYLHENRLQLNEGQERKLAILIKDICDEYYQITGCAVTEIITIINPIGPQKWIIQPLFKCKNFNSNDTEENNANVESEETTSLMAIFNKEIEMPVQGTLEVLDVKSLDNPVFIELIEKIIFQDNSNSIIFAMQPLTIEMPASIPALPATEDDGATSGDSEEYFSCSSTESTDLFSQNNELVCKFDEDVSKSTYEVQSSSTDKPLVIFTFRGITLSPPKSSSFITESLTIGSTDALIITHPASAIPALSPNSTKQSISASPTPINTEILNSSNDASAAIENASLNVPFGPETQLGTILERIRQSLKASPTPTSGSICIL